MQFTLTITSNNDVFTNDEDNPIDMAVGEAIVRVAVQVSDGIPSGVVRDPINGQAIGTWEYKRGETD